MANINLLPWREEAREQAKRDYLLMLGIAILMTCVLLYSAVLTIEWMTEQQQQRNQYLRDEITLLDRQIAEIKEIKQRKADIEQRTDIILQLQQVRNVPTHIMDELARIVPTGIYLTQIERKQNMLWIDGHSESNNNVANMMRKVTTSDWLTEPNMQSIVSQSQSIRQLQQFNLNISITDGRQQSVAQEQLAQGKVGVQP